MLVVKGLVEWALTSQITERLRSGVRLLVDDFYPSPGIALHLVHIFQFACITSILLESL